MTEYDGNLWLLEVASGVDFYTRKLVDLSPPDAQAGTGITGTYLYSTMLIGRPYRASLSRDFTLF